MKITKIECYQIDLPYAGGVYQLSGDRTYHAFDATIVRLETDTGLEGYGESTPFGANYIAAHAGGVRAGLGEIAPLLIGQDPRRVDRINDLMDQTLAGHHHAKTPVDIACWDLFGKFTGLPVCELLGGSTDTAMPVISSIHAGDPDDMRSRVADYRDRGYRGHSIKIGAADDEGGPLLDAERVRACLSDRQPGEYFLADANGGMTPEMVKRFLRLLPEDADLVLEAPCASWAESASVRRHCSLPIVLDELVQTDQDIIHLIRHDLADGIGLKISKAGGLTHARRHRDMATAAGLTMSVQDTVGSTIAFAGIAHLGQTVNARWLRCILDCRDMVTLETARFDAPLINGGIRVPKTPGLGLTVDRSLLGEPVAQW